MLRRFALLSLFAAVIGVAADWPCFMGPTHNGCSTETGLARAWPDGGPAELWRIDMGKGFGGAVVVGGRVYVQDREGESRDLLRCLDAASGKELWRVGYDAPGKFGFPGSRGVPAVTGNRVVSCGPLGHLVCVDTDTARIVWQRHIWDDFGGGKRPMWAFSQNPLLLGDLAVVLAQTNDAGAIAFEVATGKVRWQTPALGDRAGYVSPALVEVGGRQQIVVVTAGPSTRGRPKDAPPPTTPPNPTVFGLDPTTGEILWRYAGWQCETPACLPLDLGGGKLLLTGGYRSGSVILQLREQAGNGYEVTETMRTAALGCHVHMPVVVDGYVYGNGTTNHRKDGMTCVSLDGKLAWKTGREPLFDKGGLLVADGLLISMDGKGILRLIEPNPEKLSVLAEAKVLDTPQAWAPLALADGRLLVRDQKQLKCLDLRRPDQAR